MIKSVGVWTRAQTLSSGHEHPTTTHSCALLCPTSSSPRHTKCAAFLICSPFSTLCAIVTSIFSADPRAASTARNYFAHRCGCMFRTRLGHARYGATCNAAGPVHVARRRVPAISAEAQTPTRLPREEKDQGWSCSTGKEAQEGEEEPLTLSARLSWCVD